MPPRLLWFCWLAGLVLFSPMLAPCQSLGQDYWFQPGFLNSAVQGQNWGGAVGFGLTGTGGNSENLDLNLTIDAARKTDAGVTDFLFNYFYTESDLVTSTDRIFSKARHEHHLANPALSWYVSGTLEWDRFSGYDYRVAMHSGAGLFLWKEKLRLLKTRAGIGTSREFGGVYEEWIPELQLGLDWERTFGGRTKLSATNDYYPGLDDFSRYRVNTRVGLDTVLDANLGLGLGLFILNRYNHNPDPGFQPNDMDYGVNLTFDF